MAAEYVRTHGRKVDEIMSRDLVWATADTRLDSLVGIVSRADCVARSRARSTKEPLRPAGDGGEHVLAELAKPVRAPREGLTIAVRDEVADRNGVIFDEKEHEALRAAAENAPGSKPSTTIWSGSNRSPTPSSMLRNRSARRPNP